MVQRHFTGQNGWKEESMWKENRGNTCIYIWLVSNVYPRNEIYRGVKYITIANDFAICKSINVVYFFLKNKELNFCCQRFKRERVLKILCFTNWWGIDLLKILGERALKITFTRGNVNRMTEKEFWKIDSYNFARRFSIKWPKIRGIFFLNP